MKFKDIIKNNPFYGVSEIIYDYLNTKFRLSINKDRLEKLKKIYVGIDSKEIEREYFIISKFLFLKKGGTNSIILLTLSFVLSKEEENFINIICNTDKHEKIEASLLENAARE